MRRCVWLFGNLFYFAVPIIIIVFLNNVILPRVLCFVVFAEKRRSCMYVFVICVRDSFLHIILRDPGDFSDSKSRQINSPHTRPHASERESVSLCFLFHVLCFNNLFGYGAARFFRFFLSLRRDGEMIEKGEKTFQHSLTSSSSSASSCFYKFAGLRACLAGAKRRPMTKIFFVALLWLRAFVQGIITIM